MTAKEFIQKTSPSLNEELEKNRLRSSVASIMDDYCRQHLYEDEDGQLRYYSNDSIQD